MNIDFNTAYDIVSMIAVGLLAMLAYWKLMRRQDR